MAKGRLDSTASRPRTVFVVARERAANAQPNVTHSAPSMAQTFLQQPQYSPPGLDSSNYPSTSMGHPTTLPCSPQHGPLDSLHTNPRYMRNYNVSDMRFGAPDTERLAADLPQALTVRACRLIQPITPPSAEKGNIQGLGLLPGYMWNSCARSEQFTSNVVVEKNSTQIAAPIEKLPAPRTLWSFPRGSTHVCKKKKIYNPLNKLMRSVQSYDPCGNAQMCATTSGEVKVDVDVKEQGKVELPPITDSTLNRWSQSLDDEIKYAEEILKHPLKEYTRPLKPRFTFNGVYKPWTQVCQRVLPFGSWANSCARVNVPYSGPPRRTHDPFSFLAHKNRSNLRYAKNHWLLLRRKQRELRKVAVGCNRSPNRIRMKSPNGKGDRQKRNAVMDDRVLACLSLETQYQWWIKGDRPPLSLGVSSIDRVGVFVADFVPKGRLLLEYAGEVVRKHLADIREQQYAKKTCMSDGRTYMFALDDDFVVDATRFGSLARFANHSCQPNCGAKVVTFDEKRKILLFANRDIEAGEELTYDYKLPFDKSDRVACFCAASNCRKYLN